MPAAPASEGRQPASGVDGNRAFAHVKAMVDLGPRPAGSEAIARTRDYIRQQMTAIGLTAKDQALEWGRIGLGSFDDLGEFRNVRIKGTSR